MIGRFGKMSARAVDIAGTSDFTTQIEDNKCQPNVAILVRSCGLRRAIHGCRERTTRTMNQMTAIRSEIVPAAARNAAKNPPPRPRELKNSVTPTMSKAAPQRARSFKERGWVDMRRNVPWARMSIGCRSKERWQDLFRLVAAIHGSGSRERRRIDRLRSANNSLAEV